MEIYDVIKKIVGPIEPVGESNEDEKRFKNLEVTIDIVDKLLFDLLMVSKEYEKEEHSVKKIGKRALEFLQTIYTVEWND